MEIDSLVVMRFRPYQLHIKASAADGPKTFRYVLPPSRLCCPNQSIHLLPRPKGCAMMFWEPLLEPLFKHLLYAS